MGESERRSARAVVRCFVLICWHQSHSINQFLHCCSSYTLILSRESTVRDMELILWRGGVPTSERDFVEFLRDFVEFLRDFVEFLRDFVELTCDFSESPRSHKRYGCIISIPWLYPTTMTPPEQQQQPQQRWLSPSNRLNPTYWHTITIL